MVLQQIVDWFFYNLLKLPSSTVTATVNFFVYDSIKILLILFVMIFVIGILRSFVSAEKIKKKLEGRKGPLKYIFASIFGAVTPFCSCSSVPIFISFIRAGVPLGVAFSFLITSPLIDEFIVALMLGLFGVKITLIYIFLGMFIGVTSGMILGRLSLEKYLEKDISFIKCKTLKDSSIKTCKQRVRFGFDEAKSIVAKVWIYVLVGVGIGAMIHNYVPAEFFGAFMQTLGAFSVPIAVIVGIPMYGSGSAILPIIAELIVKGVPIGTAIAFMMAIVALSLPEAIILRRVLKLKLIAIFFLIVAVSIILVGYVLNILL